MTNQETLDLCGKLGVGVKTQSSTIIDQQADRVRARAERDGLKRDVQPEEPKPVKKAAKKAAPKKTTEEGGAQPKEYTAKYAADRVRNTSVIWLGLTMGCSECHNHKYDPLTTKDFYSFQAFFADIAEKAVGRQDQTPIPTTDQEQQVAAIDQQLTALDRKSTRLNSSH